MPGLNALRENYVHQLQNSIRSNLDNYTLDDPWVPTLASFDKAQFSTRFDIKGGFKMVLPEGEDHHDLENAIRLHKAFMELTPLQAQDPRLWVRLTHVELWRYMRARWPVEKYLADRGKAERYVLSRYFVAQRQSRALLRNGAARLWWAAKVTHDPGRKNPYELTRVLLSSLDIAQQLLERNLGRIPSLNRTFLDYLLRHKRECLDNGDKSRVLIRRLAKALNFQGGVCILDCMSNEQILAVLDQEKEKTTKGGYKEEANGEDMPAQEDGEI
jgi:hypothetical protein